MNEDMEAILYSCLYIPPNGNDMKPCGCTDFTPDNPPDVCKQLRCNFLRAFCAKKPMSLEAIRQRLEGQLLYDVTFTGDPYGDDFRVMKVPVGKVLSVTKQGECYHLECRFGGLLPNHKGVVDLTQAEIEQFIAEQDGKLKLPDYE